MRKLFGRPIIDQNLRPEAVIGPKQHGSQISSKLWLRSKSVLAVRKIGQLVCARRDEFALLPAGEGLLRAKVGITIGPQVWLGRFLEPIHTGG